MSGSIGVIADTWSRTTNFYQCLTALRLPVNTAIDFRVGADRGRSRNSLVEASLERGSEWMLFLDDDHSFPSTLLLTLLSREMPVVASLYLERTDPFLPIAYADKDEEGNYWPLDLSQVPAKGLVSVRGAGTGGMLIRSEVFRHLEAPWFIHTTQQSEDLYFCDRLADQGIPLYVDLEAPLGHIAPFSVFPVHTEGKWAAGIAVSPSMQVLLDIQSIQKEQTADAN